MHTFIRAIATLWPKVNENGMVVVTEFVLHTQSHALTHTHTQSLARSLARSLAGVKGGSSSLLAWSSARRRVSLAT